MTDEMTDDGCQMHSAAEVRNGTPQDLRDGPNDGNSIIWFSHQSFGSHVTSFGYHLVLTSHHLVLTGVKPATTGIMAVMDFLTGMRPGFTGVITGVRPCFTGMRLASRT